MTLIEAGLSDKLAHCLNENKFYTTTDVVDLYRKYGIDCFWKLRLFGKGKMDELKLKINKLDILVPRNPTVSKLILDSELKRIGRAIHTILFFDDVIDYGKLIELNKELELLLSK